MRRTTGDGSPVPVQLLVGITDEDPHSDDGLNPWCNDRKFDPCVQKPVLSAFGGTGAIGALPMKSRMQNGKGTLLLP